MNLHQNQRQIKLSALISFNSNMEKFNINIWLIPSLFYGIIKILSFEMGAKREYNELDSFLKAFRMARGHSKIIKLD